MIKRIEELIKEWNLYIFQNNSYRSEHWGQYSRISIDMQTWIAVSEDTIFENFWEDSSPWRLIKSIEMFKLNWFEEDEFTKQKNIVLASLKACLKIIPNKKQEPIKDSVLVNIFDKFDYVAKQLRKRHNDKQTLDIQDEYDVQDLLHALLRLYYDDVRPEEWNPSYAWSSKRSDFLLKNENTIIEVKKTRKTLKAKELGEELIIDIANYRNHPNCKNLYCFVYDPDWYISNPRGIEKDLKQDNWDLNVTVFIRP